MNLVYVANVRLPTEKAHGVQIMKMCEAFALAGASVTLLVPRRRNLHAGELFSAYGVGQKFSVEYLPVLELPLWLPGAFWLQTVTFGLSTRRWLQKHTTSDAVYTRGEMVLLLARLLPRGTHLVWETHIKPGHPERYRRALAAVVGVVAITKHFASEIPALWGISPDRVFYAPDGVDVALFTKAMPQEDARKRLGLPLDKKIVIYTGSDLPWKGLRYLRAAALLLPENYEVCFVGPIAPNSNSVHQRFVGIRPYTEMPQWLAAADVLVLTGDPQSSTAQYYTSPMKLFEYLASSKSVVAMRIPSFLDVLTEHNSFICEPDAESLAIAIQYAVTHPGEAELRVAQASQEVIAYGWQTRAKSILGFVNELTSKP